MEAHNTEAHNTGDNKARKSAHKGYKTVLQQERRRKLGGHKVQGWDQGDRVQAEAWGIQLRGHSSLLGNTVDISESRNSYRNSFFMV